MDKEMRLIYLKEDLLLCYCDELISFDWKYKGEWFDLKNSKNYIDLLFLLDEDGLIQDNRVCLKKGFYKILLDEEYWDIFTNNFTFDFIAELDGFPYDIS